MKELFFSIGDPFEVFYLELSLRGILEKNISQNISQLTMNFQKIHPKIWPKNGMFSFKMFLLFWVRAARERAAKKEGILVRKR